MPVSSIEYPISTNGGKMKTTRREFVGLLALSTAGCAADKLLPTESPAPDKYEFSATVQNQSTVAETLKDQGLKLRIDRTSHAEGNLITHINGRRGDWRIDLNGEWFGPDATTVLVKPGDEIGCWRI